MIKNKVYFFHTVPGTLSVINNAVHEWLPDTDAVHMIEQTILPEIQEGACGYRESVSRRLCGYAEYAAEQGASAVVNLCTAMAFSVPEIAGKLPVPLISVEEPVLTEAILTGKRAAVLITAENTRADMEHAAAVLCRRYEKPEENISIFLVPDAMNAIRIKKDPLLHNQLIAEMAEKLLPEYEVIALAQTSMQNAAERVRPDATVIKSVDALMRRIREVQKNQ